METEISSAGSPQANEDSYRQQTGIENPSDPVSIKNQAETCYDKGAHPDKMLTTPISTTDEPVQSSETSICIPDTDLDVDARNCRNESNSIIATELSGERGGAEQITLAEASQESSALGKGHHEENYKEGSSNIDIENGGDEGGVQPEPTPAVDEQGKSGSSEVK